MTARQVFMLVVLAGAGVLVEGYGSGAPTSVCTSMLPSHGSKQTSSSLYNIHVSEKEYAAGGHIIVAVTGGTYSGLMLQARRKGESNTSPVGKFAAVAANTKSIKCNENADTVTHSSTSSKSDSATYTWVGPPDNAGPIEFVATVNANKMTWWSGLKSRTLAPATSYPPPTPSSGGTKQANISAGVSMFVFVGVMGGLILYDMYG